jgi:hypothetical protein
MELTTESNDVRELTDAELDALLLRTAGTTMRRVIVVWRWAFKLARGRHGARCNLEERNLYHTVSKARLAMLCPVVWCSGSGRLLVVRAADRASEVEAAALRASNGFPDWLPARATPPQ